MSDSVFDGQIFAEKLSKLNSSQQSIESLSRLCISHRKKARQIVETWDKAFSSAQREQRVSFLYLANDILQNSRRKGSEFVNEFWKVLPAALKNVYENGDENGKKAACRLVDIWEERKVFGSRGQNLKDEMLGKHPLKDEMVGRHPPPSISNGRNSNPIKIVKRDSHSLRIKLAVGGMPEKILTAFQSAHDENVSEENALNKCKAAASLVGKMETSAQGNQQGSLLIDEIQEQENILEQCVSQLENAEATRGALVSQLKEAIQEQELKRELIRTQLHVARGHIEHLGNMKHMLTSPHAPASLTAATNLQMESPLVVPSVHSTANSQLLQPVNSFASVKTSEEENKKAAAAAVAAKLTASTSSAQMLTSILSSLVAEEAASMSSGALKSSGFTSSLPMFSAEKRPRLENPLPGTDVNNNPDMGSSAGYFTSMQSMQTNQMQAPFPPPPPPPAPPGNSPGNQFVQPGVMMGVMPYAYGATSLPPPPPPLPSHIAQALARPPLQPPLPQQPPPQQQQQQQQSMNGGYYRPPGIGFHGQSHQPTTPPPVPRQ